MMQMLHRSRLYLETARHLRPVQVAGRIWFRAYRPPVDFSPAPVLRRPTGRWTSPVSRPSCSIGDGQFVFLNTRADLARHGWDDPRLDKLWRYNLHYFDCLSAGDSGSRADEMARLMQRWVEENPPAGGTGWEPYPVSLRIVNWIKWALAGNRLSTAILQSLAVQTRWLASRLEHHLLGNHLLANAKALAFAGLFWSGPEAQSWLATARKLLSREIHEQILPDGGHFELSPMYHAIILEDLLDLVNLDRCYPKELGLARLIEPKIADMLTWLAGMTHPDGGIAFFNDAAFQIAASCDDLKAYANRLRLAARQDNPGSCYFADSGYVRLEAGPAVALLDVGSIGPDYIPGHAHADTLSFELSVAGQRVFVNGGTSHYRRDAERLRQRGTAAHNTVTVTGRNSSQVWDSFRVAQRARPHGLTLGIGDREHSVTCAHDGYRSLKGRVVHQRTWTMQASSLRVRDTVSPDPGGSVARFHFHPDLSVTLSADRLSGRACKAGGPILDWQLTAGQARLVPSTWHPEFGLTRPSECLEVALQEGLSDILFTWSSP